MLNEDFVSLEFHSLSLDYLFFNCSFSDQAVHIDWLALANSMSTIHSLEVDLWIEVGVIQHDVICCGEIDA